MSALPATISRTGKVVALCGAALALTVPAAFATITPSVGSGSLDVDSDAASDDIALTCTGGQVKINGGPDQIACASLQLLGINGNGGDDDVDLSALQAADFPQLRSVSIDSGVNTGLLVGSFFGDVIDATTTDTVQGLGGNDVISHGDDVSGGDGDDILDGTQGFASGGAGDDRIVTPGGGPFDGGSGYDSLETRLRLGPS